MMMNKLDISVPILGPPDANDDDNLHNYFVLFGDFQDLNRKSRFAVVGAKGTGKSAIKKHLSRTRESSKLPVIEFDESLGFSLSALKTQSPAEIKNKMKGYLKTIILQYIASSSDLTKEQKNKVKKLLGDTPLYQRLLQGVTIKAGIIEYALSELFPKNKRGQLARLLDPSVNGLIMDLLGDKDLWVFIDDIDTIFTSDDNNASLKFVEGLIYAVSDLSVRELKKKVWIVLLLRSEIYEELTRLATEMDKETTYFWKVAWDDESLKKCLSERVRWAAGAKEELPGWKYWALLFDTKNKASTTDLQSYLLKRLMNGPRDLILLTELARRVAHAGKAQRIAIKDLEKSEYEYGETKLRQINSNFQRIYPDIDKVVDRLFRKKKQVYSRKELETKINKDLLTNPTARQDFSHLSWVRMSTPFLFVDILYRVGIVGYFAPSEHRYIYVLQRSNPDKTLLKSTRYKIHSALSAYLELEAEQTKKKSTAKTKKK